LACWTGPIDVTTEHAEHAHGGTPEQVAAVDARCNPTEP
jgi:hypothetical protein